LPPIRQPAEQIITQNTMENIEKNSEIKEIELVGSIVIENKEGKILLTKSPKWNNKWTLPGGHIEPGESIENGLLREAKEETGLNNLKSQGIISFGELINSNDFYRPAHFIYFAILCITDENDITLEKDELSEYLWIEPNGALNMDLGESYDKVINDYLKFRNSDVRKMST